jgi:predicted MFS family arabinose efflux permease
MGTSPADVDRTPVILIGLAVAFSLLGDVTIYAVIPVYHEALGLGPVEVGILLSANRWVRLVTNQIARRVLERHRPRHVFAVVLLAGSVITLVYAAMPPFWLFLAARMAWGAVWSFIRHTGVMTSIGAAPRERAAGILGIYNGTVQLGFIAGTLAGAALFDLIGFPRTFVVMSLISLSGIIFDYLAFRRLPSCARIPRQSSATGPLRDFSMLLRSFVTTCVGVGLIISTLGFTLRQRFGDTVEIGTLVIGIATLNGLLIALHYGISSVGSPPIGMGIDRIGRRLSEIIAFSVGTVSLATAAFFADTMMLIPVVIVFFLASVACRLSLTSRAGLAGSASFSRVMTAADLGAATGPLVGWLAIERVGSVEVVFGIGAVLYAVATVTALAPRSARRAPRA